MFVMAKMYLMTGPSGAGKTTLARELVAQRNLKYMGIEDFYAYHFGSELIHEDEDEVWAEFEDAIRDAENTGIDILVDTNSPSRSDREWFVERFPNYVISLVIVECDPEICLFNNRNRERKIPEAEMRRILDSVEKVSEDEMKLYDSVELYRNSDNSGVKFISKLK